MWCVSVLQGSSCSLPPSPLTLVLSGSPCACKRSRVGGRAAAVLAVLLAPFHKHRISVSLLREHLVGQGEKEISIFQGRKNKGEFLFFHMA